jgi:hypothetical protein
MVRFGTKRVGASPPFSISKQKKPVKGWPLTGFLKFFLTYLLAAYSSATLFQLIRLKNAFT